MDGEEGKEETTRVKKRKLQEQHNSDGSEQSDEDQGHLESQSVKLRWTGKDVLIMGIRQFLKITRALQEQQAAVKNNRQVADFQRLVTERKLDMQRLLEGRAKQL